MSTYNVKVLKQDGQVVEMTTEAETKYAVYEQLKNKGDSVLSVDEQKKKGVFSLNLDGLNPLKRIKMHDKILIARNLSGMLDAGLAVSRAINVLERQSHNKKLKEALGGINADISGGKSLHEALGAYPNIFSSLFVSMVRAGEESGSLAKSLKTVALQMERSFELTRKIKGAMMYPSIIVTVMLGIGFFMLTYIVPQITATFKEMHVPLPITTQVIIGVSDFLKNNVIVSIILILSAIAGIYVAMRTAKGKRVFDFLILRAPVIGTLVKETNSARTARTMSSLLSAGVDVLVATQITCEVIQNSYYKEVLKEVGTAVEKGEPISAVFASHERLYPPFVSEMTAVGEETGQMAQMLVGVADFYETEVEEKTKDMSTIIEPVLMVVIGITVGFFAVSMIGPIYSIGDAIQ